MFKKVDKNAERLVRHLRVRKKISGTEQRPRLSVYRSSKHIYAQIINDVAGHTLVAASTVEADVKALCEGKTKTEQAQIVGKVIGERALAKGIDTVVFDRGGYLYTGRVATVASGAREAGLKF
jgi:large subunit ribosomal protein L18